MESKVNKWLDLLDRSGWTALQAAASALLVYLTDNDSISWDTAIKFVVIAAVISVLKVIVGQNTGTDATGSLIGQSVIEPPPTSKP